MAELVERGFITEYTIAKMRSIKVTESGDFNGKKYEGSVKVKAVNVMQEDDDKYGLVEKEQIIEFRIPCADKDLRAFNSFLRKLQKENKPLKLTGNLPSDGGKDTFLVTSYLSAGEIMTTATTKDK